MKLHFRLTAIAKNEALYLADWAAHHFVVGFDSILIYNNDSTDCSLDVLAELQAHFGANHFNYRDFPRTHQGNARGVPQINAYNDAIRRARVDGVTHLMFLDLDEYLILNGASIQQRINAFPHADCISYHWLMYYGNKNRLNHRPIADRFQIPVRNHEKNNHVKSIARIDAIRRGGPHICCLADRTKAYLSDGNTPNWDGAPGARFGGQVNDLIRNRNGLFVAHFQSKSVEEYCIRRMKGCVLAANGHRNVTHRPLPPPEENPDLNPPRDALPAAMYRGCPEVGRKAASESARARAGIKFESRFFPQIQRYVAEQMEEYTRWLKSGHPS